MHANGYSIYKLTYDLCSIFGAGGWWWCKGGRVYCFSESGGPLKLMTGVLFVMTMMGVCIRNVRQRSVYKFSHVSNNSRLTTQIRLQDPGWVWFIIGLYILFRLIDDDDVMYNRAIEIGLIFHPRALINSTCRVLDRNYHIAINKFWITFVLLDFSLLIDQTTAEHFTNKIFGSYKGGYARASILNISDDVSNIC